MTFSHSVIQGLSTIANPYTVLGLLILSEHLGLGLNAANIKDNYLSEQRRFNHRAFPRRPVPVSTELIQERNTIEEHGDRIEQGILSKQARKPLVYGGTIAALLLPIGLSVYHHVGTSDSPHDPMEGIMRDTAITAAAHALGFVGTIWGLFASTFLMPSSLSRVVIDRLRLKTTVNNFDFFVSGTLARLGTTFCVAYYFTKWWG